ncbi:winged helix DNA-binding protein [Stappia indica]|uniref:winged helix DNA-binding protein n=1 Tax=Stappia indica TaxID=538381 RepID=UPI00082FA6A2|nr:winged helix DNA-binding protein [Stappia indica]
MDDDRKPQSVEEFSRILSDLEFAIVNLSFGFHKWVEICMSASGTRGLSPMDILVLHGINLRARGRRLAEICMVLNIDDAHLVSYSLKKLLAADLARVHRRGRESHYETTELGDQTCDEYRRVRDEFLVPNIQWFLEGRSSTEMQQVTLFLKTMTAMYDQSGRSATAAAPSVLPPPVRTKR